MVVFKIINCLESQLAILNNPETMELLQPCIRDIIYTCHTSGLNKHLIVVLGFSYEGLTRVREPFLCVGCHLSLLRRIITLFVSLAICFRHPTKVFQKWQMPSDTLSQIRKIQKQYSNC